MIKIVSTLGAVLSVWKYHWWNPKLFAGDRFFNSMSNLVRINFFFKKPGSEQFFWDKYKNKLSPLADTNEKSFRAVNNFFFLAVTCFSFCTFDRFNNMFLEFCFWFENKPGNESKKAAQAAMVINKSQGQSSIWAEAFPITSWHALNGPNPSFFW